MKLGSHFGDFLNDVVNLNASRIELLEDSIEAIKGVVRSSTWGPRIRGFAPQGSWAHKTIIKPVEGAAFDADLLVYVDPKDGWDAKTYIEELYKVFKDHGTYWDKVRRYSHCVTIEYAGERKIDLAPCIKVRSGTDDYSVCNRTTNEFEPSAPMAYTDWLIDRNTWTGSNTFRKVTRLLKYLRDIKGTFTCPSVLLTTLLGYRVTALDKGSDLFADVPTALKTIMGRLDDWLQNNPTKPTVRNPVLWAEVFSGAWDDTKYANFRDKINTYRTWIDDAYDEQDRAESIGKWRRVFGDDFAKSVVLEEASGVSTKARAILKSTVTAASSLADDLVSLVKRLGSRALPPGFSHLPHMHRPRWRALTPPPFGISVSATLHPRKNGPVLRPVPTLSPVPKDHWLRFEPRTQTGMPLANAYEVQWRVTNTDQEALRANCPRGEFNLANDGLNRWETLSYRGVHLVEAFVIRKRDDMLVATSSPFYVVIE